MTDKFTVSIENSLCFSPTDKFTEPLLEIFMSREFGVLIAAGSFVN